MTDQPQEAARSAGGEDAVSGAPATRGPGAPKGNKNSSKANRLWRNTIERAIAQSADPDVLRNIANQLLAKALEGDLGAIKELGDRLDGKAAQQVIVNGDEEGGPVQVGYVVIPAKT